MEIGGGWRGLGVERSRDGEGGRGRGMDGERGRRRISCIEDDIKKHRYLFTSNYLSILKPGIPIYMPV